MSDLKVTILGCRGSATQTDLNKSIYGLNTSSIVIESKNEFIIIDCGSGLKNFDKYIYDKNLTHKKINILITHYHHDHINGLYMANFLYDKDLDIEIFGTGGVREILSKYYSLPYFPTEIFSFSNIKTRNFDFGDTLKFKDLYVETIKLNHTDTSVGYKLILNDKKLSVITDYEYKTDPNKLDVENFIKNSDCLIMDSTYTDETYMENWGHSTCEDLIELTQRLDIDLGVIYHHNFKADDTALNELEESIKKLYSNIVVAKEGMELNF